MQWMPEACFRAGPSPNDALAVAPLRLDLMPVTTFGTEPGTVFLKAANPSLI